MKYESDKNQNPFFFFRGIHPETEKSHERKPIHDGFDARHFQTMYKDMTVAALWVATLDKADRLWWRGGGALERPSSYRTNYVLKINQFRRHDLGSKNQNDRNRNNNRYGSEKC
jgi:hypothetical protein